MVKRRAVDNSDGSNDGSPEHNASTAKRARIDGDGDNDSTTEPRVKNAKGKTKKKVIVAEEDAEDEAELDARLSTNFSLITADQDDEEFEAQHEALVLDAISKRAKKKGVRMCMMLSFCFI